MKLDQSLIENRVGIDELKKEKSGANGKIEKKHELIWFDVLGGKRMIGGAHIPTQ